MDRTERRILKLRKHVLSHNQKEEKGIKETNDLSKDEIIELLKEKGIEHNSKDKKEVLLALLEGE